MIAPLAIYKRKKSTLYHQLMEHKMRGLHTKKNLCMYVYTSIIITFVCSWPVKEKRKIQLMRGEGAVDFGAYHFTRGRIDSH